MSDSLLCLQELLFTLVPSGEYPEPSYNGNSNAHR